MLMNAKFFRLSSKKCRELIIGCNEKVKEIRSPKYTHLLIITTTFSLTIPSNFKGNIK